MISVHSKYNLKMKNFKILSNNLRLFVIFFLLLLLFINIYFLYGNNTCNSLSNEQRCVCFEISQNNEEGIYSQKEILSKCVKKNL